MIRVLGLDLGRKTGWAVVNSDGQVEASGVTDLPGEGTALPMMALRERVEHLLDESTPIDLLAAEAPNIMPGQSMEGRRMAFGLSVQVELISVEYGLQLKLVSTQSLKSVAAGVLEEPLERKGKAQSIRAVTHLLGRPPVDDNEADAVLVGLWAMSKARETQ